MVLSAKTFEGRKKAVLELDHAMRTLPLFGTEKTLANMWAMQAWAEVGVHRVVERLRRGKCSSREMHSAVRCVVIVGLYGNDLF